MRPPVAMQCWRRSLKLSLDFRYISTGIAVTSLAFRSFRSSEEQGWRLKTYWLTEDTTRREIIARPEIRLQFWDKCSLRSPDSRPARFIFSRDHRRNNHGNYTRRNVRKILHRKSLSTPYWRWRPQYFRYRWYEGELICNASYLITVFFNFR